MREIGEAKTVDPRPSHAGLAHRRRSSASGRERRRRCRIFRFVADLGYRHFLTTTIPQRSDGYRFLHRYLPGQCGIGRTFDTTGSSTANLLGSPLIERLPGVGLLEVKERCGGCLTSQNVGAIRAQIYHLSCRMAAASG